MEKEEIMRLLVDFKEKIVENVSKVIIGKEKK